MISTPESGVDSIALTYSLLDPFMAVARPVTAFVTALAAGLAENLFSRPAVEIPGESVGGCSQACCAASTSVEANPQGLGAADKNSDGFPPLNQVAMSAPVLVGQAGCLPGDGGRDARPTGRQPLSEISSGNHINSSGARLASGLRFAFGDLMTDIAGWFVLGVLIAGLISALVPESLVSGVFGSGLVGYLAVLAGSLPMYVCASMSTPIAAALVAKGMSPGAALVLLMAGPATNVATVTMVAGLLGKRTLAVYLAAIVLCTLLAATTIDAVYSGLGMSIHASAGAGAELLPAWFETAAALLLGLLICRVFVVKVRDRMAPRVQAETGDPSPEDQCSCKESTVGGT